MEYFHTESFTSSRWLNPRRLLGTLTKIETNGELMQHHAPHYSRLSQKWLALMVTYRRTSKKVANDDPPPGNAYSMGVVSE
jgi:hypothetical protein